MSWCQCKETDKGYILKKRSLEGLETSVKKSWCFVPLNSEALSEAQVLRSKIVTNNNKEKVKEVTMGSKHTTKSNIKILSGELHTHERSKHEQQGLLGWRRLKSGIESTFKRQRKKRTRIRESQRHLVKNTEYKKNEISFRCLFRGLCYCSTCSV